MCGIVAAIGQENVTPILLNGLQRLEYRGYDSAGVAVIDHQGLLLSQRAVGKVSALASKLTAKPLTGSLGIAHTRWATHGIPCERNAHPHVSGSDIAVVHNGIIENHDEMREQLQQHGYRFDSDTDTEVISHCIAYYLNNGSDLLSAVQQTIQRLRGAYALAIISPHYPEQLIGVCQGAPLVIGLTSDGMLLASDQLALLSYTKQFVYLVPGDVAVLHSQHYQIYHQDQLIERSIHTSQLNDLHSADSSHYPHFMLKEIHEQAIAVEATLQVWLDNPTALIRQFGKTANTVFKMTQRILIVACGTSYHAGLIGRYWLESLTGIPCQVEIASEFRYRQPVLETGTLLVTISQSGETADTIAALRLAKKLQVQSTLAICNVNESTLARESDCVFITQAGPEIGVASTKAFTAQLTALLLLTGWFAQHRQKDQSWLQDLAKLAQLITETLQLEPLIKQLAVRFVQQEHALFLGRGTQYPIALEGALKLKELAYIQCEAYPAGELKHGPLALVDGRLAIVMLIPYNAQVEKILANLHEVRARGGHVIVFADPLVNLKPAADLTIINMPSTPEILAPIIYTLPLQLLAYYTAVLRGNDVDQPRNLAKSVTVE